MKLAIKFDGKLEPKRLPSSSKGKDFGILLPPSRHSWIHALCFLIKQKNDAKPQLKKKTKIANLLWRSKKKLREMNWRKKRLHICKVVLKTIAQLSQKKSCIVLPNLAKKWGEAAQEKKTKIVNFLGGNKNTTIQSDDQRKRLPNLAHCFFGLERKNLL